MFRNLARRLSTLNEVFHSFSQSFRTNTGIMKENKTGQPAIAAHEIYFHSFDNFVGS
jgi:hypothetical protein